MEMFIMVCSTLWALNDESERQHITPISLGLVTTKFIDTKSVSREPGGYKCTAIWDIYNLCTLDVVICKKNFRGILMGLRLRREEKIFKMVVCPLFSVNHFYTKRKMKSFWYLTNSAIEPVIIEKKRISSFYFNSLLIWWLGSHELYYMAHTVASNTVQFSQQRSTISIDQCPSTQNR